jgi:uncharacterized short protein YbdD (DUF466 family)
MKKLVARIFQRSAQTLRLMVGVGDYDGYLAHMQEHHPEAQPMSHSDYFRYCQNARYPTKDAAVKRCPC